MIASQLSDTLYSRLSNRTFPVGSRKIFRNELQLASEYIAETRTGLVLFPYDDVLYLQTLIEELSRFKLIVCQFEILSEASGNRQLFDGKRVAILYHPM